MTIAQKKGTLRNNFLLINKVPPEKVTWKSRQSFQMGVRIDKFETLFTVAHKNVSCINVCYGLT